MTSSLSPYVPRLAAEWELDTPDARWRELDATCCFVDISGFTALSERLAKRGRIGAEELTEVLDHVFARMLAVAYEKGGSLLKFGGDALLLLFSGPDDALRGAQAAVAMRAALREARTLPTSVGRLNLRMSVGVHSGTFHFFRVGSTHRELIVAGPAATQTTEMEGIADANEIVISRATAALLPADAVGGAKGNGQLLRWRAVVAGGPGFAAARAVDEEAVTAGIPVALREHLREGAGESEHRVASVGFVKFLGVDDLLAAKGGDATADALDTLVVAVQEATAREDVTILASDIDANGGKLILVAGVPSARDDDEGRILRATRTIIERDYALAVKIGVNRGHVFAGEIGAPFRRTFTVMGDTVNLAARLMAAAVPGHVYATADVLARSRTVFATEMLEPFHVKGKTEPVQAYAVGRPTGVQQLEESSLPFSGRERDLATLTDALRDATDGRGHVVVIEADRGAGKTRLLHEFLNNSDTTLLSIQGESHASASAYAALRGPLRDALGIDAHDPIAGGQQLATVVAQRAPNMAPLISLLAPLLDVDVVDTDAAQDIANEYRRNRTADLLIEVLDTADPLVVLVDDAHWLDDASGALLERVFAAASERRWLAIAARRPSADGFRPPSDLELRLAPIDDTVARYIIDVVTTAAPLRPQDRDQLVARAAGNPLFMEELLRHGRRSGFEELPDTLDAVATREIDALAPPARRIVRYASVLGRTLERELLAALLDIDEVDDAMLAPLSSFLGPRGDLLEFRHALLQEAAYASLPFRTRADLHRKAAEAILLRPSTDHDADEAALSLHFFLAQDWERTWKSARLAGLNAEESLAPGEAATHFERAVTAARRLGDVAGEEVAEVLTHLGEAYLTTGLYEKAEDAYTRAAATMKHRPVDQARLFERRSYVRGECQGRLTAAIRHARAGVALLDTASETDFDADRVRAQLLAREADFRYKQGRLRDAAKLCGQAMVLAERIGDHRALAVAMSVLDSCLVEMGRADEATHTPRVLELYEELGDQLYVAITILNLGGLAYFASRWREAGDYFVRAAAAAERAGDLATAAIADVNLGEVRVNQGRLDEAQTLLVRGSRTLESYGYAIGAAQASLQLARVQAFTGDHAAAVALIERAMTTLDNAHVLVSSLEARARLAEVSLFAGDNARAAAALTDARALETKLGESPLSVLLDRLEIVLAAATGAYESARKRLALAREQAQSRGDCTLYDELVLLNLAERIGLDGEREIQVALARDLEVDVVPGLPDFSGVPPVSA